MLNCIFPLQGEDSLVSRLLKTSRMNTSRSESAVFPLLSKLPNIKNTNPFSKKDAVSASTTGATLEAAAAATATDAVDEAKKDGAERPEDGENVGDSGDASATDGNKVRHLWYAVNELRGLMSGCRLSSRTIFSFAL